MVDKILPTVDAIVEVVKTGTDIAGDIKKTDDIVKSKDASATDKIAASVEAATHIAADLISVGAKLAPVVADDIEAAKGCFACCAGRASPQKRRIKRKVPYSPSDDTVEDAEAPARKKKKRRDRVSRTLSSMEKTVVNPTVHPAPPADEPDKK